jgi:hypothetical protein
MAARARAEHASTVPRYSRALRGVAHHGDARSRVQRLTVDADPRCALADDAGVLVAVSVDALKALARPHHALGGVGIAVRAVPLLHVA